MQVAGQALFSGAGLAEACVAASTILFAGPLTTLLHSLSIAAPLVITSTSILQLALAVQLTSGSVDLTSTSGNKTGAGRKVLHGQGHIGHSFSLPAWSSSTQGQACQRLQAAVWCTNPLLALSGSVSGSVDAPSEGQGGFACHPAALDSAQQLGWALDLSTRAAHNIVPVTLSALTAPNVCVMRGVCFRAFIFANGYYKLQAQGSPLATWQLDGIQWKEADALRPFNSTPGQVLIITRYHGFYCINASIVSEIG